jgi:endonuclease/exonuclease/phosphatase family metal-dependent hydrolase
MKRTLSLRPTFVVGAIVIFSSATLASAFDPLAGDYSKDDPLDVRVLTYNHLGNFISDPSTDAEFNRILTAINPDIICFQEFSSGVSSTTIANRLNSILPQPGGWQIHLGIVAGTRNVIASRYPLSLLRTDTIPTSSTRGVTIALADLPDADYAVDLYLLGVHLKCCGDPGGSEDASRQRSADAMANWLGDARGVARPSGNNIVLPADTPMIALGDFNFVGGPQPETTLRTGDIQSEGTFGSDVKGDWDVSDLLDLHPIDPFTGDDFTWQGSASFPPGRLDRIYVTDSVITVANDFILNTDTMTPAALAAAGLQAGDTLEANSSDHLPLVADFHIAGCPDDDGDGVCNAEDLCPGGDDNVDGDADGVPDFCDPCPADNPDDTDGDGVCDSADICPGGDDGVDTDGDGTPDFCDACSSSLIGDLDCDGDVDLVDFAALGQCFGGSNNPPAASCPPGADADLDDDGDVDLSDFATFAQHFTGSA